MSYCKIIKNKIKLRWRNKLIFIKDFLTIKKPAVALNQLPISGPWGGGNQFLRNIIFHFTKNNLPVCFSLQKNIKAILIIANRLSNNPTFLIKDILKFKKKYPKTIIIQRINDTDKARTTKHIDNSFKSMNETADITYFLSEWVKEYHSKIWFDNTKRHIIIHNGADPAIFYPGNYNTNSKIKKWKLITHHWSPNPNKGWSVYKHIDDLISNKVLKNIEFTVIGQWPEGYVWKNTRALPPLSGKALADEIRNHHIYITAAKWEAFGMHHVEAVQCGLPVLFHKDGGGINEFAQKFGIEFNDNNLIDSIQKMIKNYNSFKSKTLANKYNGTVMLDKILSLVRN